MSIKDLRRSAAFSIAVVVLFVLAMPFLAEQVGRQTGLFNFPLTKWLTGFVTSDSTERRASDSFKVDWEKQLEDLKQFSEWADGRADARISIVRPDTFQIVRADPNNVTASHCAWKLQAFSELPDISMTQIRKKLRLVCDPADRVSGEIVSVKPLTGARKGFLVTVDRIRGEGKVGLSYDGLPPIYYDVKRRQRWLVPVASCRSAMKGRYDSAVFFPGMEMGLSEGSVISPSADKCGYRILSVSDHCVWFEAFDGAEPEPDQLPHSCWPDFSRVDTLAPTPPPGRLIFGRNRCFWPGDAIRLPKSGMYLAVDDFMAGRAAMFKLLDSAMLPVRDLLCVIVREK